MKRNEVLIHITMQINLENVMLSERGQIDTHTVWFHLYEISRIGTSMETEGKSVVAGGLRGRGYQE